MTHNVDTLIQILLVMFIVYGTFATILFLYLMAWVVVLSHRFYKVIKKKKLHDPNTIIEEVDNLLRKQQTDYLLRHLAK
jgi:hypothetical protein